MSDYILRGKIGLAIAVFLTTQLFLIRAIQIRNNLANEFCNQSSMIGIK